MQPVCLQSLPVTGNVIPGHYQLFYIEIFDHFRLVDYLALAQTFNFHFLDDNIVVHPLVSITTLYFCESYRVLMTGGIYIKSIIGFFGPHKFLMINAGPGTDQACQT